MDDIQTAIKEAKGELQLWKELSEDLKEKQRMDGLDVGWLHTQREVHLDRKMYRTQELASYADSITAEDRAVIEELIAVHGTVVDQINRELKSRLVTKEELD
jgi:hypothetical protein